MQQLVRFVQRLDPRWAAVSEDTQRRKEEAAARQEARQRRQREASLRDLDAMTSASPGISAEEVAEIERLARVYGGGAEEQPANASDEEDDVVDEFVCAICEKTFKSEQQYAMHTRSKKHLKAVRAFERISRQFD